MGDMSEAWVSPIPPHEHPLPTQGPWEGRLQGRRVSNEPSWSVSKCQPVPHGAQTGDTGALNLHKGAPRSVGSLGSSGQMCNQSLRDWGRRKCFLQPHESQMHQVLCPPGMGHCHPDTEQQAEVPLSTLGQSPRILSHPWPALGMAPCAGSRAGPGTRSSNPAGKATRSSCIHAFARNSA